MITKCIRFAVLVGVLSSSYASCQTESGSSEQEEFASLWNDIKDYEEVKAFEPSYREARAKIEPSVRDKKARIVFRLYANSAIAIKNAGRTESAQWKSALSESLLGRIKEAEEKYNSVSESEQSILVEEIVFWVELLEEICWDEVDEENRNLCREMRVSYDPSAASELHLEISDFRASKGQNQAAIISLERYLHSVPNSEKARQKLIRLLMAEESFLDINSINRDWLFANTRGSQLKKLRDAAESLIEGIYPADVAVLARKLREQLELYEKQGDSLPSELTMYVDADSEFVEYRFIRVSSGSYHLGFEDSRRSEGAKKTGKYEFGVNAQYIGEVCLPTPFFVLDREITEKQWSAIVTQKFNANDAPKGNLTWNDSMQFCLLFSDNLEVKCRLPTEWEWECCARSTKDHYFPWGPEYRAFSGTLEPVSELTEDRTANGIFNIAAGLREWCLNDHQNMVQEASLDGSAGGFEYRMIESQTGVQLLRNNKVVNETQSKVIRGGKSGEDLIYMQAPLRRRDLVMKARPEYGFRPIICLGD
ncbi:MAG: SUMF1/EgtB/PvdO family nonheme iron enzyme [Planctomycetota bacterium]